jgi:glutamate dehydrogenase
LLAQDLFHLRRSITRASSLHHIMSSTPVTGPQSKLLEQVIRTPGRMPSPQPTHLAVPGHSTPKVLPQEGSGYVAPKFEGKEKQMEAVMDGVEEKGFIPADFVESETTWFYNELGIDDMYFATETVEA